MHKINCMQIINRFQRGKYLAAYVLKEGQKYVSLYMGMPSTQVRSKPVGIYT